MQNLNDVLAMAGKGDVEAMRQLIQFYTEQGEQGNADYWEEKKSLEEHASLAILHILTQEMEALSALSMGMWDTAQEVYAQIREEAYRLLEMYFDDAIAPNAKNMQTLNGSICNANYGMALAVFVRDNDMAEAVAILEGIQEPDTKQNALLGVARFNLQDYREAYAVLSEVVQDLRYAAAQKGTVEEAIYADALNDRAAFYRIGLPGIVKQDLESAVNILRMALESIRDEDYRRHIQAELNRYKKKMFGGYKYV